MAASRRVYRTVIEGPLDSLDPIRVNSNASIHLLSNLVEPLLRRNAETGFVEPAAAESFKFSKDGLTLTFALRQDLFFSNGDKVTAKDFIYSLRRLLSPDVSSWVAKQMGFIRGAEEFHEGAIMDFNQLGIRAQDERKLVVRLRQKNSTLLDLFAFPATAPVHRETVERYGERWWDPKHWVGNGPFIPRATKGPFYLLQKNPHHRWASKIELDDVYLRIATTPMEGVKWYNEKKVDQFGYRDFSLPLASLMRFSERRDLVVQADLRTYFLRLNPVKLPSSQQKFRAALAMAIDRNVLSSGLLVRGEKPAFSLVPPGLKRYEAPRGYLFNPPGAIKELRNLGYCTRGMKEKDCKPLRSLTLIHRRGDRLRKIALMVKLLWKEKLGLKGIRLKSIPAEDFRRKIETANYQIALDDLAVESEQPFGFLDAFESGERTAGGFSSRPYSQLLQHATGESDWKSAKEFLRRAEKLLLRDGGIIPLFHGMMGVLVSPRVRGFRANIWDLHPFAEIRVSR